MQYTVVVGPPAQRQLAKVRGSLSVVLHGAILTLGDDPRPSGALKLAGSGDLWRIRLRIDGQPWRIVYQVDDNAETVRVLRVVRRDEGTHRGI